jgi:hypothetical protein
MINELKFFEKAKIAFENGQSIDPAEFKRIRRAKLNIESAKARVNDKGELESTPRFFRMSGFLPIGIPMTIAMLMAAPTIRNTVLLQWLNQSYFAGVNYANKNESCPFTTNDLIKGYSLGVSSSIATAVVLRKLTQGLISKAPAGSNRVLVLNTFVNFAASAIAGALNTRSMR